MFIQYKIKNNQNLNICVFIKKTKYNIIFFLNVFLTIIIYFIYFFFLFVNETN